MAELNRVVVEANGQRITMDVPVDFTDEQIMQEADKATRPQESTTVERQEPEPEASTGGIELNTLGSSVNETNREPEKEQGFSFWGGNIESDERGFDPIDGFGEGALRVGKVLRAVGIHQAERRSEGLTGKGSTLWDRAMALVNPMAVYDPEEAVEIAKAAWAGDPKAVTEYTEFFQEKLATSLIDDKDINPNPNNLFKAVAERPVLAGVVSTGLGVTGDLLVDPLMLVTGGTLKAAATPITASTKLAIKHSPKKVQEVIKAKGKQYNIHKAKVKVAKVEARAKKMLETGKLTDSYSAYWQAARAEGLTDDLIKEHGALGVKSKWKVREGKAPELMFENNMGTMRNMFFQTAYPVKEFLGKNINPWKALKPTISAMNDIHPAFGFQQKRFEYNLAAKNAKEFDLSKNWVNSFRKFEEKERIEITRLLSSGKFDEATAMMPKDMRDEFSGAILPLLKSKYKYQVDTMGIKGTKNVTNFFPRSIKDPEGLTNYIAATFKGQTYKGTDDKVPITAQTLWNNIIQKKKAQLGRGDSKSFLTPDEYGQAWVEFALNPKVEAMMKRPAFTKGRKIKEFEEGMMKFTDEADNALIGYITKVNSEAQKRELFGKLGGVYDELDQGQSIASLVGKYRNEGKITHKQMEDLKYMYNARFVGGEQAASPLLRNMRAAGHMIALANPYSSATQLGDIPSATYMHGVSASAKGIASVISGKPAMRFNDTALDLSAEYSMHNSSVKWIDNILKHSVKPKMQAALDATINKRINNPWKMAEGGATDFSLQVSGFRAVDMFGKDVHLNSALIKWSDNMGTAKGEAAFRSKYKHAFTKDEMDKVITDFKTYGKFEQSVTDDMRYVTFSELLDVQPVTMANLPPAYLNHPNWRIAWSLKTFMLKQWDLLRNTAGKDIKAGRYGDGILKLGTYGVLVGGANGVLDASKAAMRGDFEEKYGDTSLPEFLALNTMRILGGSSYTMNKAAKGEFGTVASDYVMPPAINATEDLFKSATGQADWWRTVRNIPITGKALYYMFGTNANEEFGKLGKSKLDAK